MPLSALVLLLLAGGLPLGATTAQTPYNPEKSRALYTTVASHLDTGGDILVVANVDGALEQLADALKAVAELTPANARPQPGKQIAARLPTFMRRSGLYGIDGFGMSVVPRADGLNDLKLFLARDPAAAQTPFWLGTIGGAPHRLATLAYLPADTALARIGTADPAQLWEFVNEAIRDVGGASATQSVLPYLRSKPICPQNGTYTIGPVGTNPTCSHPGHRLPSAD